VGVVDRRQRAALLLGSQDQERDVGGTVRTGNLTFLDPHGPAGGEVHRLHTGEALCHRVPLQRKGLLREGRKGLPDRLENRRELGVERGSGGGVSEAQSIGVSDNWFS